MRRFRSLFVIAGLLFSCSPVWSAEDDGLEKAKSWSLPVGDEVRASLEKWIAASGAKADVQEKARAAWPASWQELSSAEMLDIAAATFTAVDARAQEVVAFCQGEKPAIPLPQFALLKDDAVSPLVRNNLRLLLARSLLAHDLADECVEQLHGLTPAEVVDPAGLLFHRAVAQHRLLAKEECLKAVEALLEREDQLPARYARLAHLMAADIQPLKKDSLDEISRLMEDVRRRLQHARAGKKVRDEEEEIIAKLDKMIELMEQQRQQQQQQQQQQSGQKGGKNAPSNPLPDSTPAELKGPGEVDPKQLGKKAGWGNLPPKERQEVLQQIGKELPAHFRETIEEYFQRLAQDGVK